MKRRKGYKIITQVLGKTSSFLLAKDSILYSYNDDKLFSSDTSTVLVDYPNMSHLKLPKKSKTKGKSRAQESGPANYEQAMNSGLEFEEVAERYRSGNKGRCTCKSLAVGCRLTREDAQPSTIGSEHWKATKSQ